MRRAMFALIGIAAICAVVVVVVRNRRSPTGLGMERAGDVVPGSAERRELLVEDAAEGSFPASDPPSYWGRETEG